MQQEDKRFWEILSPKDPKQKNEVRGTSSIPSVYTKTRDESYAKQSCRTYFCLFSSNRPWQHVKHFTVSFTFQVFQHISINTENGEETHNSVTQDENKSNKYVGRTLAMLLIWNNFILKLIYSIYWMCFLVLHNVWCCFRCQEPE